MKNKGLLFSLLAVGSFTATSCSGSGLRHTVSKDNKVYHADLNFNGKIDSDEENLTWVESYDALLKKANSITDLNEAVKAFNIDPEDPYATAIARYEILHEAEELIMSTGAVLPLCNYIDPYLLKKEVKGIYTNSLGFKFLDQLTTNDKPGGDYAVTVGTKAETFDPANNSDASTSIALFQIMAGAKRYVKSEEEQEGEEGKGVYKAVIEDGVCEVTKKLVTEEDVEPSDKTWINIEYCPDLKTAIESGKENAKDYEGTARYTIEIKPGAVWNDGSEITIDDFIYAWTRASSATYNGQPFGMWCQLFDSIRGYNVWNTIGQQTTSDPTKWDESTQAKWNNTDPNEGTVLTDADKYQYGAKFNDLEEGDIKIKGTGCAGGMAGVIKGYLDENGEWKDDEKHMTVQLVNDCSYFDELLAFTAYMPVKKEKVLIKKDKDGKPIEDETKAICTESPDWWMNKDKSYLTNGPMQINGPIRNQDSGGIDLVQAEHATPGFVDENTIKSLKFLFIDKDSTMYDAYRTGSVVLTNNFPIALIDQLKTQPDWHAPDQIGLYFYTFNVNDNTFDTHPDMSEHDREKLRIAFANLINRYDIGVNVYKKGKPADGYVSAGVEEYMTHTDDAGVVTTVIEGDKPVKEPWQARNKNNYEYLDSDEEHYKAHRFDKREAGGFFEIPEKPEDQERVMKDAGETAIKLAKEAGINYDEASGKFTNFPRVTISTNNGTAHEDVAERIQAYMGLWGIDVDVQVMEWQSFTAARRTGDYAVARQGWIADYNDPRSYLDCARSTDGNDDTQLGKDSWHASH